MIRFAQDIACTEFPVGSKEWTDCIEGAATGGGLMPWIVVIPLGVMVLGMAAMFTYQYTRPRDYTSSGVSGVAGVWLIFMSLIEGAIGAGMVIAESRADGSSGGFAIAATALLGTAAVLLVIGLFLVRRASSLRKVERDGRPGHARVMGMSETGTRINNQPVIAYDLEVNVPGMAPYRITKRLTTPLLFLNRVSAGTVFYVKVDPNDNRKLVVDWSALSQATFAPGSPAAGVDPQGFRT